MVLDQPRHRLGLGRVEPEPGPELAGDRGAGLRMILGPALGDIVQEQAPRRRARRLRMAPKIRVGERMLARQAPGRDFRQDADGADQVLVDRVVVIHVELHHRDDAAEIRNEAAEHSGFVHAPQHDLRRVARGQDVEEQPVRLGIAAQGLADQPERPGRQPRRVRMGRQVVPVREPEQADQVDRIALEHVLARAR